MRTILSISKTVYNKLNSLAGLVAKLFSNGLTSDGLQVIVKPGTQQTGREIQAARAATFNGTDQKLIFFSSDLGILYVSAIDNVTGSLLSSGLSISAHSSDIDGDGNSGYEITSSGVTVSNIKVWNDNLASAEQKEDLNDYQNLVAYYPIIETSGNILYDVKNGYNAQIINPSGFLVSGDFTKIKNYLDHKGYTIFKRIASSDNIVNIGATPFESSNFAIEFDFVLLDDTSGTSGSLGWGNPYNTGGSGFILRIEGGRFRLMFNNGVGDAVNGVSFNTKLIVGVPYKVEVLIDRSSNGIINVYNFDGSLQSTNTQDLTSKAGGWGNADFNIGSYGAFTNFFRESIFSNFKIYSDVNKTNLIHSYDGYGSGPWIDKTGGQNGTVTDDSNETIIGLVGNIDYWNNQGQFVGKVPYNFAVTAVDTYQAPNVFELKEADETESFEQEITTNSYNFADTGGTPNFWTINNLVSSVTDGIWRLEKDPTQSSNFYVRQVVTVENGKDYRIILKYRKSINNNGFGINNGTLGYIGGADLPNSDTFVTVIEDFTWTSATGAQFFFFLDGSMQDGDWMEIEEFGIYELRTGLFFDGSTARELTKTNLIENSRFPGFERTTITLNSTGDDITSLRIKKKSNNLNIDDGLKSLRVITPDEYQLVVGDTFQLFYRGIIEAVNPYNYHIEIVCNSGNTYPRYFEWTPVLADIGTTQLSVKVYRDDMLLLGEATINLVVKDVVASPSSNLNVLCVGDSLTNAGIWPVEAHRRLTAAGGAPVGESLSNITFIGDQGTAPAEFVGYSGKTWGFYNSENDGSGTNNPFWVGGGVDFSAWFGNEGFSGNIDVVYTLLTWNGLAAYRRDTADHASLRAQAETFLDNLIAEYPNVKVHIMGIPLPSVLGGLGIDGANGLAYANYYGLVQTVMGLNLLYKEIAQDPSYTSNVTFINLSGQVDVDFNFSESAVAVNSRNSTTERRQTNNVHPNTSGYNQIADAVYRHFVNTYCQ
ncbi:MAG: hypothetical protein F6K19_01695 [Cyanothece sp. SIO1E1]|nr:hypothetical protein [Cyanothece sp. SIO1E1]